jgi:hypothetical protein
MQPKEISPHLSACLVFIIGLVALWPFALLLHAGLPDEGLVSMGCLRVYLGEVPYLDFVTRIPPGSYLVGAAFFALLGPTVEATRVLMVLNGALLGTLVYLVSRSLLPWPRSLFPWACFCCTGLTQYPILSHHWLADLGVLALVLCLQHWVERPAPRTAALAGLIVAVTGWILQSEGAALLLACLIVLGLYRASRQSWLVFVLSVVGTSLALFSRELVLAGPAALWEYSVRETLAYHVSFNRSPYSLEYIIEPWRVFLLSLQKMPYTAEGCLWLLHSVLYLSVWAIQYVGFYPVLLISLYRLRSRGKSQPLVATVVLACVALATIGRQDMLYINFIAPLFYCLLFYHLPNRLGPQLLLVGLYVFQFGFQLSELSQYRYLVQGRGGSLWSQDQAEAESLQRLLKYVASNSKLGDRALAYPYGQWFYLLSGTRPVSRYGTLLPRMFPQRASLADAQTSLAQNRTALIYRLSLSESALDSYPNVDRALFGRELEELDAALISPSRLRVRLVNASVYASGSATSLDPTSVDPDSVQLSTRPSKSP